MEKLANTLRITSLIHCKLCLDEFLKDGDVMIPINNMQQITIGYTKIGIQIWCNRHQCNILNIDFEGQQHPENLTNQKMIEVLHNV